MHKRFFIPLFAFGLMAGSALATAGETVAKRPLAGVYAPLSLSMLTQSLDMSDATGVGKAADDALVVPDALSPALPELPSEATRATWRRLFLQAETAIAKGQQKKYRKLAVQLRDYPLYPYLEYQWLVKNLHQQARIETFLREHGDTRYAGLLKRKWLSWLARKGKWQTYRQAYESLNYPPSASTRLHCYYQRSVYRSGERDKALQAAEKIWAVGHSQPKACDPLFKVLKKSAYYTPQLVWQRFEAAMRKDKTRLAGYIKKDLPAEARKQADFWLQLHRDPERYLPKLLTRPRAEHAGAMFAHAIRRYASRDIEQAILIWDHNSPRFSLSEQDRNRVERRLAFKLAFARDIDEHTSISAFDRLGSLQQRDRRSKTLRIRLALQEQNWRHVITAIEDLDANERDREKWRYWLARAYEETGRPLQANEIMSELSERRDFYGYLAAEKLGRQYQLVNRPLDVAEEAIEQLTMLPAFRMADELRHLQREREAKLQWWHALKGIDESRIPAAARLAQRWHWDEIAIFTIAKVEYWDDVELRFPRSYQDEIFQQAAQNSIDPVILFGLIRRESAFNNEAHSPVGARGLMQIMPKTARQIARELNHKWRGSNSLFDPEKNLRYGAYYYSKLLEHFDGHYALALAAYNAGPNRVKKWLPEEAMPADIWIETIPFRETRDYVTHVLVYAMIYRQLLGDSSSLNMQALTREVLPLQEVAAAY